MKLVIAWLLRVALELAPYEKAPQFPGHEEQPWQRRDRVAQIAKAIALRVDLEPALDGLTKAQSAALVLALAVEETELALDADEGPCFRGVWQGRSWAWRCDGGLAVGVLQIHVPLRDRAEYFAHRGKVLAVGYRHLRRALLAKCRPDDRLAVLARGCRDARSVLGSRKVFALWRQALAMGPAPEWPTPEAEPVG